jgi:hypothetical protein
MENELSGMLKALAQQQATLHARCNAQQLVLLAAVTALGKANAKGYDQIEHLARAAATALYGLQDVSHIDTQRELATILGMCRAAVTGK